MAPPLSYVDMGFGGWTFSGLSRMGGTWGREISGKTGSIMNKGVEVVGRHRAELS